MAIYYKKDFLWNFETGEQTGLPRPHVIVPESLYFVKKTKINNPFKRYLHKIVPIPWQSIPKFFDNTGGLLSVNIDHEKKVITDNLCSYCGLGFNKDEICSRWISQNISPSEDGIKAPRVFSDSYPQHLECMKQTRRFCPFMRILLEEDFEYGEHHLLLLNAKKSLKDMEQF
jgi:hypothetical protein